METIDAHAHMVIADWFEGVRKDFPEASPRIEREGDTNLYSIFAGKDAGTTMHVPELMQNVPKRLRRLDKLKIDLQLLSPVPSLLFTLYPIETALVVTRAQNDGIAQIVKDYPGRFEGLCSVPLQDPEKALPELERAINHLGLKGVEIGTNINGVNLDDRSLWPFYKKVEELGVPILVHPINIAAADRLKKYYLSNLIGNPLDTSIAIASIIFGGVLEDFPKLKFFFVHGGGFTPYQRGRLDHGFSVRPEPKAIISKKPSTYLPRIFVDTIVHYDPALEYLVKTFGSLRILLGSDFPFDMGPKDPLAIVKAIKLGQEDRRKIHAENAAKLFRLKR
ncbi:MAG: amidohydrolase family protein [Nitrososphaerales archaeon]